MYKSNIEAFSCNHFCRGKAISITYECVYVDSVSQHVMRMRHIVICCLYWLTVYSKLSHNRHDFREIIKSVF